jgi:tetratricopeptide (TPR) repeat protein
MLVGAPAATRLATAIGILGNYVKLLFIPYPLICDYSYNSIPLTTFGNPWVLLSLAVYLFLGVFSMLRLVRNRKDPFAFAILFFLVAISLFSNIVFLIGSPMAERFLFFGSVGFCLAVALAIEKWILKTENAGMDALSSTKVLAIIVPLGLAYTFLTVDRNGDWADNLTLFRADVNKSQNDARLTYYFGTELAVVAAKEGNQQVKAQMMGESVASLRRSIQIYPEYENALAELGNVYFMTGVQDSAEIYDNKALKLNPRSALTLNNLAGVYFVTKRFPLALEICRKSIEINPKYVDAYANMGLCFLHMGQIDSSLTYLYRALNVNPNSPLAFKNMALTYRALNKVDSVQKYEALAKMR